MCNRPLQRSVIGYKTPWLAGTRSPALDAGYLYFLEFWLVHCAVFVFSEINRLFRAYLVWNNPRKMQPKGPFWCDFCCTLNATFVASVNLRRFQCNSRSQLMCDVYFSFAPNPHQVDIAATNHIEIAASLHYDEICNYWLSLLPRS